MKGADVCLNIRTIPGRSGASGEGALVNNRPALWLFITFADGFIASNSVILVSPWGWSGWRMMMKLDDRTGIISRCASAHEWWRRCGWAEFKFAATDARRSDTDPGIRGCHSRSMWRRVPVAAYATSPRESSTAATSAALIALPCGKFYIWAERKKFNMLYPLKKKSRSAYLEDVILSKNYWKAFTSNKN